MAPPRGGWGGLCGVAFRGSQGGSLGRAAVAGNPMAGGEIRWASPLCDGQCQWPWIWHPSQIRRAVASASQRLSTSIPASSYVYMATLHADPVSGDIGVL